MIHVSYVRTIGTLVIDVINYYNMFICIYVPIL